MDVKVGSNLAENQIFCKIILFQFTQSLDIERPEAPSSLLNVSGSMHHSESVSYICMKIEYYNIIYLNIYIYSIIYKIYSRTCSAQLFLGSISSVCSTAQLWPHGSRWTDVVIMFAVLVWDSYNCEINMKERDICVETKTIFWGGSVNSRPYDPTECQETWSTKGPADMASGHWLADRGNVPQLLSS